MAVRSPPGAGEPGGLLASAAGVSIRDAEVALFFLVGLLVLAGGGWCAVGASAAASTGTTPCAASSLSAKFVRVPGSQGADDTVYALTVTSHAHSPCTLGTMGVQLLGAGGVRVPTRATTASRTVRLAGRTSVRADARFSPFVPGMGEPTQPLGVCELAADQIELTFAGTSGEVVGPISPPTPVCDMGTLDFPALRA